MVPGLGSTSAYIPVNMMHNPEGSGALIARWKWLAYARRSRDVVFADETARWAQGYSISFEAPIGAACDEIYRSNKPPMDRRFSKKSDREVL